MGKTSKPLNLRITDWALFENETIRELIVQGHNVSYEPFPAGVHLLGPNCWRMLDLEYLDVTIAAIRKEVYDQPTKQIRADTGSKPVTKRHPRKPKRQVAVSPARSPESSGDSHQLNGGIIS